MTKKMRNSISTISLRSKTKAGSATLAQPLQNSMVYILHQLSFCENNHFSAFSRTYNSQLFGGADGELGASQRYLSQRYSNTNRKVAGVLTDIGVSVVKLRMGIVPGNAVCSFLFLCQSHHIVETHPV